MNWKIATSSIRGFSHQQSDTPSQDQVRQSISDDYTCVALCDGAGSAQYAAEGARFVAAKTCEILKMYQLDIFNFSDEEIRNVVISRLLSSLEDLGKDYDAPISSFSSTLMFFVSDGIHFLVGNVGDGIIGFQDGNMEMNTLLGQERGLYANESYFVTSEHSAEHLRIARGSYNAHYVFFLMTDGSCDCLFNYRTKKYARALDIYCSWCRKYNRKQVNRALFDSMQRLFSQKTNDDCALALITTDNNPT